MVMLEMIAMGSLMIGCRGSIDYDRGVVVIVAVTAESMVTEPGQVMIAI